MKLKNIILYLSVFVFATAQLVAQNTSPVVSNVAFSISGTTVTVTYDVSDAEQTEFEVAMSVSNDAGATWDYDYGATSGDIGSVSGTGSKSITWTYNNGYAENFMIRVIAQDKTAGGSSCNGTPTVSYGGQVYNTIQLGDQCWLKENLNIGTRINASQTADGSNGTIEKYCWNDDSQFCDDYGGLYNWDELMQGSTAAGVQGICPTGWHVPTFADYSVLDKFMKAIIGKPDEGKALVSTTETNGTNISGFSLLQGGYYDNGAFTGSGSAWFNLFVSDQQSGKIGKSIYTSANNGVEISNWDGNHLDTYYAVRCIKD